MALLLLLGKRSLCFLREDFGYKRPERQEQVDRFFRDRLPLLLDAQDDRGDEVDQLLLQVACQEVAACVVLYREEKKLVLDVWHHIFF